MAAYDPATLEPRWQHFWAENQTFQTPAPSDKPKFYALDMFPYPSGTGLHVGHPLGYIASDIVARFQRLEGKAVLHPMGFDSFGLPAEQYAMQTGQHPAITTEANLTTYKKQLRKIGFSFDWDREVRTSDPAYYKWTQWIFLQLFDSWYNNTAKKAQPIDSLIEALKAAGNADIDGACAEDTPTLTAEQWRAMSEKEQQMFLLNYRLAYLSETWVNWCPGLGTVLANEEVKDGFSERGGFPVERKRMQQWSLRITAYAERLLSGLETINWPEPIKDMQRYWIGRSRGCSLRFPVEGQDLELEVFTTRVDTTFGVTYLSIAPEHELVDTLTTPDQKAAVEDYVTKAKNRSERDRMADVKTVSGVFTGSYVTNPFNGEKVPVWIADYVLAGYGTGVVMAVPSSDERDYRFAQHFGLEIIQVQEGERTDISKDDFDPKAGTMINSGFLDGLDVPTAIDKAIAYVEEKGIGVGKINFRLRDAIFSRQRYWGEPIPIYFEDGIPRPLPESKLPLTLPEIDEYRPTEDGMPPLGRAKDWTYNGHPLELSTMPGWAGSSWYWFRYMDPKNESRFVGKDAADYWKGVDLYLGGAEHATGHLLYARFWANFLFDRGYSSDPEPLKKLINQGMIQGESKLAYRVDGTNTYVSTGQIQGKKVSATHVDVSLVSGSSLDLEGFKAWRPDLKNAEFVTEPDGSFHCATEVEKMSKSKWNVVNPDEVIAQYGADTLRLYEMFLGPLEQAKPWSTSGIEGVYKFLKKLWRLFEAEDNDTLLVTDDSPSDAEFKVLHKTLAKIRDDINRLSLNTSVSTFMIAVNELGSLKCSKRAILEPLLIALSPYAPHITEELWAKLGHTESIALASFPKVEEKYLKESAHDYPISINGKVRTKLPFPTDMAPKDIETQVLADEVVQKWLEGKAPKKVIVVPQKIVNVVV